MSEQARGRRGGGRGNRRWSNQNQNHYKVDHYDRTGQSFYGAGHHHQHTSYDDYNQHPPFNSFSGYQHYDPVEFRQYRGRGQQANSRGGRGKPTRSRQGKPSSTEAQVMSEHSHRHDVDVDESKSCLNPKAKPFEHSKQQGYHMQPDRRVHEDVNETSNCRVDGPRTRGSRRNQFRYQSDDGHNQQSRRGGRGRGNRGRRGGLSYQGADGGQEHHEVCESPRGGRNKTNSRRQHTDSQEEASGGFALAEAIRQKNEMEEDKSSDKSEGVRKDSGKKYPTKHKKDRRGNNPKKFETQRSTLVDQLCSNSYECMVCYSRIRAEVAVWSCDNCYHIFHLYCLKKWITKSSNAEGFWRCPGCQNETKETPKEYRCFCGKQKDPEFNMYETPHSCGEICSKSRGEHCSHPCNILCHPGPCPRCEVIVKKSCNCGKTTSQIACHQSAAPRCDKVCGKQLNCGLHQCQAICHGGVCQPCDVSIQRQCYCGDQKEFVTCGTSESFQAEHFSCGKICDGPLACGSHHCTQPCHSGQCPPCVRLPLLVTRCPCGRTPLSQLTSQHRDSCTDVIPSCDQICGKPLPCGSPDSPHLCRSGCHEGPCTECEGTSRVTCRCGAQTNDLPCSEAAKFTADEPYTCERRCNKKKSCGRHKCLKSCCTDEVHSCENICGWKLECGLHRCEEPCHRGKCPRCYHALFDELRCYCGAAVLYPPVACGTRPPECNRICSREHSCQHPVRHSCHSEEQCPPCTALVSRRCVGGHEMRHNIPCHLTDITCGLPCNRALPCGLHKCQKPCHKGECLKEEESCTLPCKEKRAACGHPCAAPCHGDSPCPLTVCLAEVVLQCACGRRKVKSQCRAGGLQQNQEEAYRLAGQLQGMMYSGQSVELAAIMSKKQATKRVECDNVCALEERNKRLALALEIQNPDVSNKLGSPSYSDFLVSFARKEPTITSNIERALSELVKTVSAQKQLKSKSHMLPAMKFEARKAAHELAELYGCQTQSLDQEPNKSVVLIAAREKCWLPNVSLTTFVQREKNPRAPPPVPHAAKEEKLVAAYQASKQSTEVAGRPETKDSWDDEEWTVVPSSKARPTTQQPEQKKATFDYFDMKPL